MQAASPAPVPSTLYDFSVKNIDGKSVKLSQYRGQVVLVVNVASKCGYTPQYAGLEKLYKTYKGKGFVVLGFPANDFNEQEPGTDKEIRRFCTEKYNVTFPMFSKIHVKGPETAPLYRWLIDNSDRRDAIEWNFAKFLVNRKGKVVGRFSPGTKPDDESLVKTIERQLQEAR